MLKGAEIIRGEKQSLGKTAWEADPSTNHPTTCGALGVSHTESTDQQIFIFVPENLPSHLTVYFGKVSD